MLPQQPSSAKSPDAFEQFVWDCVSLRPLHSLWDLQGVPLRVIAKRTWTSMLNDNLFGSAAELGYWFLFALFPTLVSASSLLAISVQHTAGSYDRLLRYLAVVLPPSAFSTVLATFNQIMKASNGQKAGFGLLMAIWAASAGFSAIQDAMNVVYKVKSTTAYWKVRGAAVLISVVLSMIVTATFASLLAADYFARLAHLHIYHHPVAFIWAALFRVAGWIVATGLMIFLFAIIYYWGPDVKKRQWRWLTPGSALGVAGSLLVSFGLRAYLHFFNSYTATYGSLGAVIILMTWFYLTGFMLLLGAEVNSEIEAAAIEKRVAERCELPTAKAA